MINPGELSTDELYYNDKKYFSCSLYKRFKKCEYSAIQEYKSSPTKDMLIGSYVDRFVEGTLDKFKEEHPEIFVSKGERKGELKIDFIKAEEICDFIMKDKVFSQFMSGEKQVVMTGEIEGVPFKIKIDSYSKDIAINDLKVMSTVTDKNGNYIDFISSWGYDIQMAIYQEICYQNTGVRLPVFICAVTKETPINSVIINIPQDILDIALYEVKNNIIRYKNIRDGLLEPTKCGHCKDCLEHRKETPIISMYDIIKEF